MFRSRYPIICATMNQVSDFKLGLAVYNAGCVPSFISDDIDEAIKFVQATGSHDFILTTSRIPNQRELENIMAVRPRFIETYIKYEEEDPILEILGNKEMSLYFEKVRSMGSKIIIKTNRPLKNPSLVCDLILMKGMGAAGSNNKDLTVSELLRLQRMLDPDIPIIASGAITNSKMIDDLLAAGACAVSMGTIFSVTEESSISYAVKLKMIQSSIKDIVTITKNEKNALLLEKSIDDNKDDPLENFTQHLKKGVKGQGGLVYMGHGIEDVSEILSVNELVSRLVSNLILDRICR